MAERPKAPTVLSFLLIITSRALAYSIRSYLGSYYCRLFKPVLSIILCFLFFISHDIGSTSPGLCPSLSKPKVLENGPSKRRALCRAQGRALREMHETTTKRRLGPPFLGPGSASPRKRCASSLGVVLRMCRCFACRRELFFES